jgi:amino acid transporter
MRLWDVVLFNIAAVLGPRWIAAAAHSGASSISIWVLAAVTFFLPSAVVIAELATRFPAEGGLYVWSREAFGPFHGFVAGWSYWIYTIIYFPALLNASVAMAAYLGGPRWAWLEHSRVYITLASVGMLAVAIGFNIVGVQIGKWLENVGGIGTYLPLLLLVIFAGFWIMRFGSITAPHWSALRVHWDLGTVNYWSQIAFAFSGLELVCTMSEEVRDPQRTLPRSIWISAAAIATIYILGTAATLAIQTPAQTDIRTGAVQALSVAAGRFGILWIAIAATALLTLGNVGGVGTTVAGAARIPFAVGIDRYLPPAFAKVHPRWHTPWIAMIVQGVLSAVLLVVSQIGETAAGAYQILVDATTIMYFIPFLYMFLAIVALRRRPDRGTRPGQTLVPLGQFGVWLFGLLGFGVTAVSIVLSLLPPAEIRSPFLFEVKVIGGCLALLAIGLGFYWREGGQAASS